MVRKQRWHSSRASLKLFSSLVPALDGNAILVKSEVQYTIVPSKMTKNAKLATTTVRGGIDIASDIRSIHL